MGRRPLEPPDPKPAALVRQVLAYDRRLGISFTEAWDDGLDAIDGLDIGADDRLRWTTALNQTQHAWASAYRHGGEPTALDRTLLD